MNKEQQCRTSKRTFVCANFCANFCANKAFAVLLPFFAVLLPFVSRNTLRVLCLFVINPLSHGSDDSVDQSTDGMCSSNLHPFRRLSTPTEEYCETSTAQYGSIRVTATFGGGNANRAAPLHTEWTRTLRWKCGICGCLHSKQVCQ